MSILKPREADVNRLLELQKEQKFSELLFRQIISSALVDGAEIHPSFLLTAIALDIPWGIIPTEFK